MFNSCNRLVGGTDGFVPSTTSGASVCKLGAGGVLTDPNDDRRTWFWAHYYADGEGVLTATSTPDATRELVASGRICAIGKYVGLGFTPWDGRHRPDAPPASYERDVRGGHGDVLVSEPELPVLLVHQPGECGRLGQPLGRALDALHVQLLRLRDDRLPCGFDPSTLTDLFYTFSGCSQAHDHPGRRKLGAADERDHGLAVCFYSCSASLVGGNGTAWASNKTAYTYFRIDTASTPGVCHRSLMVQRVKESLMHH